MGAGDEDKVTGLQEHGMACEVSSCSGGGRGATYQVFGRVARQLRSEMDGMAGFWSWWWCRSRMVFRSKKEIVVPVFEKSEWNQ
jgi:hypothetical protein